MEGKAARHDDGELLAARRLDNLGLGCPVGQGATAGDHCHGGRSTSDCDLVLGKPKVLAADSLEAQGKDVNAGGEGLGASERVDSLGAWHGKLRDARVDGREEELRFVHFVGHACRVHSHCRRENGVERAGREVERRRVGLTVVTNSPVAADSCAVGTLDADANGATIVAVDRVGPAERGGRIVDVHDAVVVAHVARDRNVIEGNGIVGHVDGAKVGSVVGGERNRVDAHLGLDTDGGRAGLAAGCGDVV